MQAAPVYIVDDSKIQVIILEKILLEEGFAVHTFSNGFDLIENLKKESRLPLIISDIDMPGMDGFELIENIQKSSCCHNIPFFFISSNNDSSIVERAHKMGARSFIEKPFKSDLLLQLVKETLPN
ncbi:MAG TPA: response regulator [Balneolaceae bacterium]|nr:response regulator [Balneolaceae bacterium]